jgi:hypothetical protein
MTKPPNPPNPFEVFSKEEPPKPPDPTLEALKALGVDEVVLEKLEALASVWGIPTWCAVSVVISDGYDNKVAALREAEGD